MIDPDILVAGGSAVVCVAGVAMAAWHKSRGDTWRAAFVETAAELGKAYGRVTRLEMELVEHDKRDRAEVARKWEARTAKEAARVQTMSAIESLGLPPRDEVVAGVRAARKERRQS